MVLGVKTHRREGYSSPGPWVPSQSQEAACLLAACGRVRTAGLPCLTWKNNTELTALLRVPPTHAVPRHRSPGNRLSPGYQVLVAAGEADSAKAKLGAEYRECQDSGFQTTIDAARHAQTPEDTGFSPLFAVGGPFVEAKMWLGAVDGGLWNSARS